MARISPFITSKLTLLTATVPPKFLTRFSPFNSTLRPHLLTIKLFAQTHYCSHQTLGDIDNNNHQHDAEEDHLVILKELQILLQYGQGETTEYRTNQCCCAAQKNVKEEIE